MIQTLCLFCVVIMMAPVNTALCQDKDRVYNIFNYSDNDFDQRQNGGGVMQSVEYKSETRALLYSLIATSAPIGVGFLADNEVGAVFLAFGVSIGPSMGIAYTGDIERAALGVGIRTSGVGIAALGGFFHVFDSIFNNDASTVGDIMIVGGLSLTGVSMLYDIFIESPRAVRRYNERLEQDEIRLNPWLNPGNGGAGLSLSTNF